jgi:hypothetical protein
VKAGAYKAFRAALTQSKQFLEQEVVLAPRAGTGTKGRKKPRRKGRKRPRKKRP